MEDLSGLSWDSAPSTSQANRPTNGSNYAALRPTPPNISRQTTPLSANHSGHNSPLSAPNGSAKSAGQDSFSNLLPTKKPTQLSLQERQKQLIEERARQQAEQQKRQNEQFKLDDATFWEGLGASSGTSTPAINEKPSRPGRIDAPIDDDEDDILAAFNASAPVDNASHFPPPQSRADPRRANGSRDGSLPNQKGPISVPNDQRAAASEQPLAGIEDDDDDPFGLGQMQKAPPASRPIASAPPSRLTEDDDDVLGILGKPVAEVSRPSEASQPPMDDAVQRTLDTEPRDQAIAELVEMGFSVDRSREALDNTETGVDVQAAVGWLLTQAHASSKSKSRPNDRIDQAPTTRESRRPEAAVTEPDILSEDRNTWMGNKNRPNRTDSRSPGTVEKDVAQRASELGNTLFKSANSLWKTGQKRVQKAMAEFQQEGDVTQPRWMREPHASADELPASSARQDRGGNRQPLVTDEAMMLDMNRAPSRPSATRKTSDPRVVDTGLARPPQRRVPLGADQTQDLPSRPTSRPVERLSKQVIEEQSAQAYVSPARRKKPTPPAPPPAAIPDPEPELDIFSSTPAPPPKARPATTKPLPTASAASRAPLASRPKAPTRQIPTISPSSLSQSTKHRMEGTAAFKRGDYSSAHSSYSSALSLLPSQHPIAIVLHTNRALTSLKTGDPKAAVTDADTALEVIGISRGEGEVISLDQGEPDKPMKEFYGKALMRKAEALEHMEKWTDAARIWKEAVEAGVGGALSIQGRNRCEKASGVTPAGSTSNPGRPSPAPSKRPPPPKPKPRSAADDLVGAGGKESEAVTRLRAANAAASAASDEQFALNDVVEARLNSWKNGKEGNLRGLLATLDTVLWEGAGWTKVGMGDLVLPNRCKVVYMKAIAKCHPDKIPPDASTEQRMISASVFATLNEAWDRFKRDNGL